MGDVQGFLKHQRELPVRRPVEDRLGDWNEVYLPLAEETLKTQASRCMDCGIPFCNDGCPLGNLIPDWNDLVYRDHWKAAIERLHATNNFPEFTGRLCPAPCEAACVLGINADPVTIKQVEVTIIDRAWEEGWVTPQPPSVQTGKRVAVVGSGPAGLAAAQQLTRVGHQVTVFERDDRIGGLLRYGIPQFKMEKHHLDRRLAQMEAEGTSFRTGVDVGVDLSVEQLRADHDAVILAGGSTTARDLPIPGRELDGIHQAMEFLPWSNRAQEGDLEVAEVPISAAGRRVVIIGGGDTGADCLGTSHRHGAASVHQFEIMPRPADERPAANPWPTWPMVFRTSSAHEEGGERVFSVNTRAFLGDDQGRVRALQAHEVEFVDGRFREVEGSEFELECDLVLLAMGFVGPEQDGLLTELGVELTDRGNVGRDDAYATSEDEVWVCGDMGRGQSLIVWAIAEGRACAAAVDTHLMGSSALPVPIPASARPLV
ncbi:MAG: glutamate synthase subunit beta [Nitriliruptor sp.]|nr:MAG: glutamate synthase subunit beta [Nitriliruptor sp.]